MQCVHLFLKHPVLYFSIYILSLKGFTLKTLLTALDVSNDGPVEGSKII